jgi:hypothetical protein
MKKIIYSFIFIAFTYFSAIGQNVLLTPGSSRVQNTTNSEPMSLGVKSGTTGYIDFKRSGVYSAGLQFTNSPKQTRIGIGNSNNGVDYYSDIVIDSTTRNVGFGTNNPSSRFHFYTVGNPGDGDITLESDDYPFLILKDKIIGNEGIGWKSSNGNTIGYMYHSSSAKKMYWGFGVSPIDVVIDSTTRFVGLGLSSPDAKLHTYNIRGTGTSDANAIIQNNSTSGYGGLAIINNTGGIRLFGNDNSLGALNVVQYGGTAYAPVNASAFNVTSDIASKKEIDYLGNDDYEEYITQIRNVKSATYRYNWENARTRTTPHIGFIAQSLPTSVTTEMSVNPDGSTSDKYVGYNISDMAGLTMMGIKAVDAKTQQLEATIKAQQQQINALTLAIEKLKK